MKTKSTLIYKSLVYTRLNTLALTGILFSSQLVQAQSQYNFANSCLSAGQWTQAALSQTQNLSRILISLKDNPACRGIEGVVIDLQNVEKSLERPSNDSANASERIENANAQMTALSAVTKTTQNNGTTFNNLIFKTAINAASETAMGLISGGATKLANRTRAAANISGVMLKRVFQTLPNLDTCLVNKPDQVLGLLSAATKIAGAFVSSSEVNASTSAGVIAELTNFLRNKKFTKELAKLQSQELVNSMNCLLESINQSYCTAFEQRTLLDWGIKNIARQSTDQKNETNPYNPLAGYYLLVRNAPLIATWLQRIQIGVPPKLKSDANYKIDIRNTVNASINENDAIQSMFSESLRNYNALRTKSEKQSYLLKILQDLVSRITVGGTGFGGQGGLNFFVQGKAPDLIPFELIGRTKIPSEVFGLNPDGSRTQVQDWNQYMLKQGDYITEFADPDKLAQSIESNLNKLIDEAKLRASDYYRNFLIVDRQNLVAEAIAPLGGQNLNVYQSFIAVHNYLKVLLDRIEKYKGDTAVVPMIRDTMKKIRLLVESFNKVRALGADKKLTGKQIDDAYDDVIMQAYYNFNVILQRDNFITTRLNTLINYDYNMQIQNGVDLSSYGQLIMNSIDKNMLENVVGLFSTEPTAAKLDLDRALTINKVNIEVYESFFRDTLYPIILELKLRSEGRADEIASETLKRLSYHVANGSNYKDNPIASTFAQSVGLSLPVIASIPGANKLLQMATRYVMKPNLYKGIFEKGVRSADTPYESWAQMWSTFCAHTLSFEDRNFFRDVCAGAVVKSAYANNYPSKKRLDLRYDDYMAPSLANQPTTSNHICAFRNFTRKNLVEWLTLDMQRNKRENSQDVLLEEK